MSENIGVGIIGYGYMGFFHISKVKEMEDMHVVGVFDIDESKREQAKEDGFSAYNTVEELLENKEIDLIIIATPNDSHYDYAMKALKAGKNVLCEKPAMLNQQQLSEVLCTAKAEGKIFTTHQNRRWDKDYSVVRKVVEEKLIGEVWNIYSETFGQRGVCFGWRADPEKGGGMVYDWGIHLIDQMLLLFKDKKVISISARLRSILTPAVDDYFEIELEFEGDIIAHISVGTFALQDRPRWFVFGDKGTLKLDDFSGVAGGIAKIKDNVRFFSRVPKNSHLGPSRTMAHLERQDYEDVKLPFPDDEPLAFYTNLKEALLGNATSIIKPEEMLRDMEIIDKVFEANSNGERLKVNI